MGNTAAGIWSDGATQVRNSQQQWDRNTGWVDPAHEMVTANSALCMESTNGMAAAFREYESLSRNSPMTLCGGEDVQMGSCVEEPGWVPIYHTGMPSDGVLTSLAIDGGVWATGCINVRGDPGQLQAKIVCISAPMKIVRIRLAAVDIDENYTTQIRSGYLVIKDGLKFKNFDWTGNIQVVFCGKLLTMQVKGGFPVFAGGELQLTFVTDYEFQYPRHVYGDIFIENLDQRQPFSATVNVSNEDVPDSVPGYGAITYVIRSKANRNCVLAVGSDGLRNRGWVCMKYRNHDVGNMDPTVHWQMNSGDGSIRSAANPTCILCAAIVNEGICNKGKVWIWTKAPGEEPGVHGMWAYDQDEQTLRIRADPDCLLAVSKNGLKEGGQVWMWRKPVSDPASVEDGVLDKWCQWYLCEK